MKNLTKLAIVAAISCFSTSALNAQEKAEWGDFKLWIDPGHSQTENMAYFRADLCVYSPESYTLKEKRDICNDMISTSKAVLDAMREDFDQFCPGCPSQAP